MDGSLLETHHIHKRTFCAMKASQLTLDILIYLLLKRDEHDRMVHSIYNWYKILGVGKFKATNLIYVLPCGSFEKLLECWVLLINSEKLDTYG